MIKLLFGIFIILHGLVHLLYFGQSAGYFELSPGLVWPDGAWAFSKLLGNANTRMLANVLLILAALAFVIAGTGMLAKQNWWRPVVLGAAILSSITYFLLWDGGLQRLPDKGLVGILINLGVLALIFVLRWPA